MFCVVVLFLFVGLWCVYVVVCLVCLFVVCVNILFVCCLLLLCLFCVVLVFVVCNAEGCDKLSHRK